MIRYTRDGLPIVDPAWMQDELSDRGDPLQPEDEEGEDDEAPDSHLEQAYEDAQTGGWAADDSGYEVTPDEELEAWLAAREAELDEQAFALADQDDARWPR
ncbi:MAG: hypothetical protein ACRDJW_25450 [Thermomicrobiales bacterium]